MSSASSVATPELSIAPFTVAPETTGTKPGQRVAEKHLGKKKESAKMRRLLNGDPEENKDSSKPEEHNSSKSINWAAVIWIGVLHAGLLASPFFFTWQVIPLVLVLHWITGGIGICLGFHRMLTHGSFSTYPIVRYTIAFIGGLAGEGSAVDWVANHRKHHALSDHDGDPHSPRDGAWWSHIFWLALALPPAQHAAHVKRWAPDLVRDKGMRFIANFFLPSHFMLAALLYGLGYAIGGAPVAASFVIYGIFVRLVLVMHSTWFVNSASHMWGYRNYTTTDDSKNNWWVAIITYGEGWHNNHHAYPRMAPHGHRWWEVDVTFATIRAMQAVGLAWDVVDYKKRSEKDAG